LVATRQARRVVSTHELDTLIRTRKLEPVRRGVYRVAGAPETWHQLLLAACLARPGAYASFRAAAAVWRFEGFTADELEITVPGSNRARLEGVVVHESTVFGPHHLATETGIPVSSVARTLCDLTAVARPWAVERAVDEALRRRIVTLRSLARVARDLEGRGRLRCTVMRDILGYRAPGYDPGDSDPERRIAALLVRRGLPQPTLQHRVSVGAKRYRIDLCYPDQRIAIEYDSWGFHHGRRAFDADRARGNDLVILGYTVLRFTSKSSDDAIVDTVGTALLRASVS
jgi:very-short-patch-repair endonuclease